MRFIVAEALLESQGKTLLSDLRHARIAPRMHADRFFQTTRGKIVSELRRRGSASATDLARSFGLSPNAVRQQLIVLEHDGLVAETSVRRGPTKPTYEFSLTPDADKLFPQRTTRCSRRCSASFEVSSAPTASNASSTASLVAPSSARARW